MGQPRSEVPLDAWHAFLTRHSAGGVLEGRVARVLPFGALVEVGDEVLGLLPRAAWSAEPDVGDGIRVRIDSVDVERRRVSLSSA